MLMNKRTNTPTELHQFQKEPSYDGDLCACQDWIRLDKLFSSYSPETKMWMDRQMGKWAKNGQTNRRNYTNFERNLAMMVIYVPGKFEFYWTNCFWVTVRKQKCGRTDGQKNRQKNGQTNTQTDKWTELHQFQKEPSYDGNPCPCQVWIRLDKLFSS